MIKTQRSKAEQSRAQLSRAQHSRAKRSTAQRSIAQRSGAQQSAAQRSGAQLSKAELSGAQHSIAQRSQAKLSPAKRSSAKLSQAEHSTASEAKVLGKDTTDAVRTDDKGGRMTQSQVKKIEIPEIRMSQMQIGLVGITPYLSNRLGDEALEKVAPGSRGEAKGPREVRDAVAEYRATAHVIELADPFEDSLFGVLAGAVKKSLLSASSRFIDPKSGPTLAGAISVTGAVLPLHGSKPIMQTDTAKLQGKTPWPVYRARFDSWSLMVPITHLQDVVSQAQVINLFRLAGQTVGIGAWRPEKKGTYGQFEIKEVVGS